MKIIHVVGARPNFMKVAPVMAACAENKRFEQCLVHTGQHYDEKMSDIFFQELGLPIPDINLEVGSGSHAEQTAKIMIRFEEVVQQQQPDLALVYGDVNSTVAAALVCAKLNVKIGHVEAGLRSGDRTMPEEVNRLVTDCLADILFTPSPDGDRNLIGEGVDKQKIHLVGNVMIDTLVRLLPSAKERWRSEALEQFSRFDRYCLVTLHRPSNVDEAKMLGSILSTLNTLSLRIPIIFPIHPRTRDRVQTLNLEPLSPDVHCTEPLSYLDFLALQTRAALVITDSGGIQEETTYLGIPCLTVRENTERPITMEMGTNILVGQNMDDLYNAAQEILDGNVKDSEIPPLWEGNAGKRIADIIDTL